MAGGERTRLRYLDGIRALAAGYVVLHHIWLTVFTAGKVDPTGLYRLGGVLNYGHFAVAVFIVVSGYSLTISTAKRGDQLPRGAGDFLRRRFWRIVPPYWAALALSVALGASLLSERTTGVWNYAVPFEWRDFVVHVALLQDFWHPSTINYLLWSIAIEWHIYFLFPLLLVAIRRWNSTAILVGVGAAALAVSLAFDSEEKLILPAAFLLACFTAGVGACRLVHRDGLLTIGGRTVRPPWLLLAAVTAVTTAVLFVAGAPNSIADVGLGCAVACLLVAMGTGGASPIRAVLSWTPVERVGIFSYSLYLIHPLVVQPTWLLLRRLELAPGPEAVLLLVTAVPLSLLVAWLFFLVAERPFLGAASPFLRRRGDTAAPTPAVPSPAGQGAT